MATPAHHDTHRNRWLDLTSRRPGHSEWYVEKFRTMSAAGEDVAGEARLVDALVAPGSHVLDAGCGQGRVGGELHRRGHRVVGVDLDPVLVDAARVDHPGPRWLVGDLAELDLAATGTTDPFDAIVCAGSVVSFLAPSTRCEVLRRLRDHLADSGRIVAGFGPEPDYGFDDFRADVATTALTIEHEFATWDLRPATSTSSYLVFVLTR